MMHDGTQYDLIQGQGQGHEPFKVRNRAVFKSYLQCHLQWELTTDHLKLGHKYLNLFRPDFGYSA